MADNSNNKSQRITITLPYDVYEKIKESAIRDTRTIGEEITHLLKLHVPAYAPENTSTSTTDHDSHGRRSVIG